jgi:hypothetical protein
MINWANKEEYFPALPESGFLEFDLFKSINVLLKWT